MNDNYFCRVCGLLQTQLPWGESGTEPTFDICDCCGVEFGYEDSSLYGIRKMREKWIQAGGKWFNEKLKPKNWNLERQIENIPLIYR
ncbi:MAG: DUF4071 domain-containing protein [Pyrinomonadaceae bacterium]|nr:DUF4071 domain-containing protein [Pyrinomonadaceae bacterium]